MFGLSVATQIFQGSTERTWNCVSNFIHLLWAKFNHLGQPIMPRSRKRHHSRSRSRSRSHSHEKTRDEKHKKSELSDRDGKRRKIDNYDSPHQKRSVSAEHEDRNSQTEDIIDLAEDSSDVDSDDSTKDMEPLMLTDTQDGSQDDSVKLDESTASVTKKKLDDKLTITPKKVLSPKQIQKRLESEKKREERRKEREEKEKQKNEEKERLRQEKIKQKQEKEEQRKKEKEQKEAEKLKKREEKEELRKKEIEEKEQKKREKEEKEEQKRKEKEQEKLKKQQEIEEKNKEKIKEELKKQKTAKAFVNFFVPKKSDSTMSENKKEETVLSSLFKPFEVKSDMRMPLTRRNPLTEEEKSNLDQLLENPDDTKSYLKDLKSNKPIGRSPKTWPYEEDSNDVEVVEVGETICEDKPTMPRQRAKFLKFHENRRPAYYGTWRKTSKFISGRKPFGEDKDTFDYEVDSDDDWEEEEQGESINGSDDEEKENEPEDDYEVDNEFFVPHGHLSDDEIDDEETSKLSPEDLKQKLKLLKDEFDQDMQSKTQKLKSRSIGCIWYNKDGSCDEEAIDRYLKPLAIISNGPIIIKKRCEIFIPTGKRKSVVQDLEPEVIVSFLKIIHGNTNKKRILVEQFLTHIGNQNFNVEIGKLGLYKHLNSLASWKKCKEEGPLRNKFCWLVNDDVQKKFKVELSVGKIEDN